MRDDGRKGIRNVVLVSYLVECAHHVAARIAQHYQQEEVHLIGFSGCAPNDYAELMMRQLCTHPNVGAVLLVSLGCENFQRERLLHDISASGRPASLIVIQEEDPITACGIKACITGKSVTMCVNIDDFGAVS